MKLLYVIDSLAPGGAERSFGSMLPGYEARGVDVHVAYLTERAGLHDDYLAGGATLHPPNGGGRISSVRHLVELIRGIRPDLVHTTLFEADVAGRTAAALTRVPSVTSLVNETYGDEHRADPSLSPVRLLGAQTVDVVTCRFARRFHAVSEHVATTMARHLLIRRDRIDVVPRGRDPATLGVRSDERRRRVRNELGLEPLDTLVLAVARNEYQKGLDVLVASMPEILATVPSARVMVAGRPGAETESLREEAVRLGIHDRFVLAGAREDVSDLLCAADVFVLPSRREGMPGAVIEAMALEAPVVASDIPQVREVVSPDTALLVPVGSSTAVARAILAVMQDESAARQRAYRARAQFLDRFTIDGVVAQMCRFYERALAS